MHTITVIRPLAAPADQVWQVLRDFDGLARWHPDIGASRLDGPQAIGSVRTLSLRQGGMIRERLESLDDGARRTSYTLVEGPLPVADYLGTLCVCEQQQGCVVEWRATMTVATANPTPVIEALGRVFADGLAGLDALVSGRLA